MDTSFIMNFQAQFLPVRQVWMELWKSSLTLHENVNILIYIKSGILFLHRWACHDNPIIEVDSSLKTINCGQGHIWLHLFISASLMDADAMPGCGCDGAHAGYSLEILLMEYSKNLWLLGICTIPSEVGLVGQNPMRLVAKWLHGSQDPSNWKWCQFSMAMGSWFYSIPIFSLLEMSSISAANVMSQLLRIQTIPHTAYST